MLINGIEYVFTDGAAIANGYINCRAGWAVFFGDGDSRNTMGELMDGLKSNQVAELTAVSEALSSVADTSTTTPVIIVTDSKYTVDCLTKWHQRWEVNNWKTSKDEPVKHQDILKRSRTILSQQDRKIKFLHVNSHQKPPSAPADSVEYLLWYGNAQADKLAGSCLRKSVYR